MGREKIEQITLIIALTFFVFGLVGGTYTYIYNNYIYQEQENIFNITINITLENKTEARPYINLTPGLNTTIKKINLPN